MDLVDYCSFNKLNYFDRMFFSSNTILKSNYKDINKQTKIIFTCLRSGQKMLCHHHRLFRRYLSLLVVIHL